jgi:hypothetical protein
MSVAGFYVAGALLVLSCAAAVLLRGALPSAVSAAAVAVSIGVFLLVSGEYLLALLEVVLLLATLAAVVESARRGRFGPTAQALKLSRWAYGLALAVLALVVLDGAVLASPQGGWFGAGVKEGLSSVLQHQAPVTTGFLVVLAAVAVVVAVVIGRTSADEAQHHELARARREREEKMRRRREDRVAARRRRQASRPGGGA